MRIRILATLPLALFILCGCETLGLESKRVDYKSSAKVPSLEIPPDLTRPRADDRYILPDNGTETVASYSDYSKGSAPRSRGAASVLPATKDVHVERSGTQRWLVVNDSAENLWPQLKAFWQNNGFVIKVDNPEAGVMETDWAENRAKIPQSPIRRLLGKVLDSLYSTDQLDMYRTRLERSQDGKSTEIYITQYSKEQVLNSDKRDFHWQTLPNDPELEAIMLQTMMAQLGVEKERAKLLATTATQVSSVPANTAPVVPPRLQNLNGGTRSILLDEPLENGWRRVGLALEHAGIGVEDRDRANGTYFVNILPPVRKAGFLDSLAFWRSKEAPKPVRYQVYVHENATGCEVTVKDENAENSPAAQQVLDTLYQSLGK